MLGMGGIFVEVLKDVSFRICPIAEEDAQEMVRELRSYPILSGARGKKPVNQRALVSTLMKVSRLLLKENPKEFDINPLMADDKGCIAVDMRILR
jgi:acyl-CoA synthetase (NDP forming)